MGVGGGPATLRARTALRTRLGSAFGSVGGRTARRQSLVVVFARVGGGGRPPIIKAVGTPRGVLLVGMGLAVVGGAVVVALGG